VSDIDSIYNAANGQRAIKRLCNNKACKNCFPHRVERIKDKILAKANGQLTKGQMVNLVKTRHIGSEATHLIVDAMLSDDQIYINDCGKVQFKF
jgi:hypothetical protein